MCRANHHFCACKIVDKRHVQEHFPGMTIQLQTEIEVLQNLCHPSIIRLYDVYMTRDKLFIVMELMEGGELFDYVLHKGALTEKEASQIVRSITSAMVYIHSKNVSFGSYQVLLCSD